MTDDQTRPTLSPAEYRRARKLFETRRADPGASALELARSLDRYDRAVRELRLELEEASR